MRLNVEGLLVIVNGVTTEEDALLAIGLGANAVAFDLCVSPRQISPSEAHDIIRRLPSGTIALGTFRNELSTRVVEVANTLGLSGVRLEGAMRADDLAYVAERVSTVLRVVSGDGPVPAGLYDYLVAPADDDAYALGAAMETFTSTATRVVASGGLDAESVAAIVQHNPVAGVEARGSVESRVGVKDPVELQRFISAARWAEEHSYVERGEPGWTI